MRLVPFHPSSLRASSQPQGTTYFSRTSPHLPSRRGKQDKRDPRQAMARLTAGASLGQDGSGLVGLVVSVCEGVSLSAPAFDRGVTMVVDNDIASHSKRRGRGSMWSSTAAAQGHMKPGIVGRK
jgi:hypothetical protein